MPALHRRQFLATSAALATASVGPLRSASAAAETGKTQATFFLVGDTHYLASKENPSQLNATSQRVCGQFVEALNRLPGQEIPAEFGGGKVAEPQGVIHAGDIIDSGDKGGDVHAAMQRTEWSGFHADYG